MEWNVYGRASEWAYECNEMEKAIYILENNTNH